MKSRIPQSVVPILLVMSLTPVICRAQAEVNPDHFDGISKAAMVENKTTSNRSASQAYGSFFLPAGVRCGSVKLAPGYYSLSVRQSGKRDVVRLTPLVTGARARALEVMATPRLSPAVPSGLLVDRINQQRTLTAISLQQPGVTLFLQTGNESGASVQTELIPISSPASGTLVVSGN